MVDTILLWCFFFVGFVLFLFSLRKPPIKDWLLAFFLSSFFATVLGTVVIYFGLIEYFKLGDGFHSNIIYELVLLPVISTYFYQTSYSSGLLIAVFQCLLYTLGLTVVEVLVKVYTNLIHYIYWNWFVTFITVFLFLFGMRTLLKFINQKSE